MKIFLSSVGMLVLSNVIAQNPALDFKYSLKLSGMTSMSTTEHVQHWQPHNNTSSVTKFEQVRIMQPVFALQIMNARKNIHEIELTELMLNRGNEIQGFRNDSLGTFVQSSNTTTSRTAIALRYEYIINFLKQKTTRFVPSLGLGLSPFYERMDTRYSLSAFYGEKRFAAGLRGFVTPRITYYTTKRLYFDLNIPLCVAEARYSNSASQNPMLPSDRRNFSSMDFTGFPKMFSARLGIGIRI
jgi:hypothetical protein